MKYLLKICFESEYSFCVCTKKQNKKNALLPLKLLFSPYTNV